MGRVCGTLEGMRIPRDKKEEEEEKGEEFDLSLELSIGGGRYAKSENSSRGKTIDPNSSDVSRPGFSFGLENGSGSADPQRRREVQAAKRQEARRKREEKLKKSSMAQDTDDDDRLRLEAGRFQSRVRDREAREREGGFLEEREREKNGIGDLNLSLFTGSKNIPTTQQMEGIRGCLFPNYPARGNGFAYPNLGINIGGGGEQRNERNRNLSVDCDSGYSNNRNGIDDVGDWKLALPNRSLEQASSAVSDYPTTSHKGGSSTSDTGSHSSPYIYRNALDHVRSNDRSQVKPEHCSMLAASFAEKSKTETYFEQTTNRNTCSAYNENQASSSLKETSSGCPTPNNNNNNNNNINSAAQGPRTMPCVSTTGNGPNGRKVTGFLYKYNQTEVIIMCVCHRSLFSPAEFVEHAGGVDVLNPLRHITMIAHP